MRSSFLFLVFLQLSGIHPSFAAVNTDLLKQEMNYRCIGPTRGGRVTAVCGIPSRPSVFFMGSTGGGVWKTTDFGQHWFNVSDGYFETGSIGAVRVAPSDPDRVFAGTGSDGLRSNVISGCGIYLSKDCGKSWSFIGLKESGHIGAVEIHPKNPDLFYVAAIGNAFAPNPERGVFRTTDSGSSWKNVLFLSDSTGAVDLELHPLDPNTLYACMWRAERKPWTILSGGLEGGVYKSTDSGETWKKLTAGLPSGLIGKSDLAVSMADPDRVYVLIEADPGSGLYRSDNRGESFTRITDYGPLLDRPFYYTNIDADPQDADRLFVSSTGFYASTDGGKTWNRSPTTHGDNHDLWIHPGDPDLWIQSNDGGASITRDGGKTWSTLFNQPTAELYTVNVDDRFPYWVYSGQQDNTTIAVPSHPPYPAPAGHTAYWMEIGGCETGPAVPRPGDPDIVYANCKGRFGRYNRRTGQEKMYPVGAVNMYGHNPADLPYRFQRVSPILVSPHDPDVIYHASQFLHRTTDEGVTWETISPDLTANEPDKQVISGSPITRDITGEEFYSTLYALAESRLRKGVIWTGANDGPVHVTTDGGKNWRRVTPAGLPSGARIQTLEASPHDPAKAYVAAYRILLGDRKPYIFRTTDFGATWKNLTDGNNGIPADCPARVVREDPDKPGLLFAGTERGIFVSLDDGKAWHPFQQNLPVTQVTDIAIHRQDLILSTMGRGFYILDNISPLHEWKDIPQDKPFVFTPRPAIRMQEIYVDSDDRVPEYPAPSAIFDYFLPADMQGTLTVTLHGKNGIVRCLTSGAVREGSGFEPPLWTASGSLSLKAGHHRVHWDLRHAGAWNPVPRRFGSEGPLVVPGEYTVTFKLGEWSQQVSLEVKMDPRVEADGVTVEDLEAQCELSLKVQDALTRARKLAVHLESLRRILSKSEPKGRTPSSPEKTADLTLKRIQAGLVTGTERYPQPMLIDQLAYLDGILKQADQRPGQDAQNRFVALVAELDRIQAKILDIDPDKLRASGKLRKNLESILSEIRALSGNTR